MKHGAPKLVDSEGGYNFVSFADRVYALPQRLGPLDIAATDVSKIPSVVIAANLHDARRGAAWRGIADEPQVTIVPMTRTPANVAFYGADHPAYAALFSGQYDDFEIADPPSVAVCSNVTLGRLDAALRDFREKMQQLSTAPAMTEHFIESRGYLSQLISVGHGGIHWIQSAPLTLGHHPWLIHIEKTPTLWLPFFAPSNTASFTRDEPIFQIVRALLMAKECLGIITNMKATAAATPVLFQSPELSKKIFHVPFAVHEESRVDKRKGRFLFTTSWHQHLDSFYNRGGVDALMIFAELSRRHAGLELVLRCRVPEDLPGDIRSIVSAPNVHVIDEKIDDAAMSRLFAEAEFYLLPAASLHSMSTLEAMAHGCVCILADAWGSDEYLHDGVNGVGIPGRRGKHWWFDASQGLLTERYGGMEKPDMDFVGRATRSISDLLLDDDRRHRIAEIARRYVADRHSLQGARDEFTTIIRTIRRQVSEPL